MRRLRISLHESHICLASSSVGDSFIKEDLPQEVKDEIITKLFLSL